MQQNFEGGSRPPRPDLDKHGDFLKAVKAGQVEGVKPTSMPTSDEIRADLEAADRRNEARAETEKSDLPWYKRLFGAK